MTNYSENRRERSFKTGGRSIRVSVRTVLTVSTFQHIDVLFKYKLQSKLSQNIWKVEIFKPEKSEHRP